MSRDDLLVKYPSLDRDIHRVDRLTDLFEAAATQGHKPVGQWKRRRDGREKFVVTGHVTYSPGARNHPRISDALDEARAQKRTVPEPDDLAALARLDYAHSNLSDRDRLSYDPDGYGLDEVYSIESRLHRHKLAASLHAATMGEPMVSVVLIDPNVPAVQPDMPLRWRNKDGSVSSSAATFPVGLGYSPKRVAELVMHFLASQCRWCDRADGRPDFGLLCSAGETVYLFPTCRNCRDELASFFADGDHGSTQSLDFIANDGDLHGTGWPADRRR